MENTWARTGQKNTYGNMTSREERQEKGEEGIAKRSRLASDIVPQTSVPGNHKEAMHIPVYYMSLLVTSARITVVGCELMTSKHHYITQQDNHSCLNTWLTLT